MFRLNVSALTSYPVAATAVLACAAIISFKIYQSPVNNTKVALQDRPALTAPANVDEEWTLASPVATRVTAQPIRRLNDSAANTHSRNGGTPPRYVLDSVPVSYDTAFRF
jgi:hypothetical protein